MIIYPTCIILAVAFILLASGFLHEALGLRPNYVVTNTQTGRLFVAMSVVLIVGMCPIADVLTGGWFVAWMIVGTFIMHPILNAALGPAPYVVIRPSLIEARQPKGYVRLNMALRLA